MKNILAVLVFSFAISFQHFFFNHEIPEKAEKRVPGDSALTATLCFVGDLMCHSTQFNYAKVAADSFDFTGVFREIKQYLSKADLTVGNLETVIAREKTGYTGYPYFNAPDDFVYALKEAGFDLLVTANNHALDQGWEGVVKTISVINENKIHRTGTFTSRTDRDSVRIFQINSIKIALLLHRRHKQSVCSKG